MTPSQECVGRLLTYAIGGNGTFFPFVFLNIFMPFVGRRKFSSADIPGGQLLPVAFLKLESTRTDLY